MVWVIIFGKILITIICTDIDCCGIMFVYIMYGCVCGWYCYISRGGGEDTRSFCINPEHIHNQDGFETVTVIPTIIKNGLAVIISIGDYDKDALQYADVQDSYFDDLEIEKDYDNLLDLFGTNYLNYNVMPGMVKTRWTEQDVVNFLKDEVGKESIN